MYWPLQLGGWLAFGIAMALSRVSSYPLDYMVATKTVLAASGLVVSLGLRAVYRRYLRESSSLVTVTLLTVGASYLAALPWTAFYNVADAWIAGALLGRTPRLGTLSAYTAGAVYHAFALLAWSVFYVAVHRHLALDDAQVRASRAEAAANAARLQALRFQLQPHFLFNTLNALSTLIAEQRTTEASRMLSRLADFLRLTLEGATGDELTVSEELEFSRRYLDIEQIRFGARLDVRYDVSGDALQGLVPSLVLQPLVENAVRHGIAQRVSGGVVTIGVSRAGTQLLLSVTDAARDGDVPRATADAGEASGGPSGASSGNGEHVGLANTRARLSTLYGDAHRMTLQRFPDGSGARLEIAIPFRTRQ